jgi:uncharacterized membrane protein (UPF0127 family)
MARRRGTLTLRREDGRVICETCIVADTALRRVRGLLGRSGLRGGEGIVLRPAWSIHTGFMRFPIDVVFLDPDLTVIHIDHALVPWKTSSVRGAREIVELPAGECERRGLEVGDRVAWASLASELADGAPPPAHELGGGRVVVATRDRRFSKLMRFLLDRHGIEADTSNSADLVAVIEQKGADVVILDASDSLVVAARAVAAAKALHPRVEIVVVAENGARDGGADFAVHDKWDGMDGVVERVSASLGLSSAV